MFIGYKLYVSCLSAFVVGNIFAFGHYVVSDTQRHTHGSSWYVHCFYEILTKTEVHDQIFSKLFIINFTKIVFYRSQVVSCKQVYKYTDLMKLIGAFLTLFVVNVLEMKK